MERKYVQRQVRQSGVTLERESESLKPFMPEDFVYGVGGKIREGLYTSLLLSNSNSKYDIYERYTRKENEKGCRNGVRA